MYRNIPCIQYSKAKPYLFSVFSMPNHHFVAQTYSVSLFIQINIRSILDENRRYRELHWLWSESVFILGVFFWLAKKQRKNFTDSFRCVVVNGQFVSKSSDGRIEIDLSERTLILGQIPLFWFLKIPKTGQYFHSLRIYLKVHLCQLWHFFSILRPFVQAGSNSCSQRTVWNHIGSFLVLLLLFQSATFRVGTQA